MNSDEPTGGSTPCFSHFLVDGHVVDPDTARDVARFRVAERKRLYAMRKSVLLEQRRVMAGVLADRICNEVGDVAGAKVAAYWPIRGELDLRPWMAEIHARGASVALPVVVERHRPVEFHKWSPDCEMRLGDWNIPVPATAVAMIPNIVVVPLLGVDGDRYRLGNGGGYYDRTLAILPQETVAIGVGHEFSRMKTIFPMPWDIPMDKVILSGGSVY